MRIPDFLCILNHHLSPVFLPALPSPKPFLYPRKHALSLRQVLLVEIRYHGIGWLVKIIAKFSMQTAVLPSRNKPKPVLRFWLIPFSIVGLADAACSVSYRMLMRDGCQPFGRERVSCPVPKLSMIVITSPRMLFSVVR